MKMNSAFGLILIFGTVPFAAQADTFRVTITDQLQGQTGFLAFDFLAGSPVPQDTVTVSNFASNGKLGAATSSGSIKGSLTPGPLTLADSSFFNEWLQSITFGTSISFQFTTTNTFLSSGIPDNFSLFLLDSSLNPYLTSDTVSSSLFSLDLNGPGSAPQVFTTTVAQVQVTPVVQAVPEPPSLALSFTAALLGCLLWLFPRRARHL